MIVVDRPAEAVLRLRLDRPERRNALDREGVEELVDAFTRDDGTAAAVVLSSNGSFCAGIDLFLPERERGDVSDRLYELYALMVKFPRPIIAAARGHAVGGGAQLLVACDLRVAAPDLGIRFPGPEHGLAVGTWALPSLLGRGRAVDICLTMRAVGAEEALRIGLVDRVAEDPDEVALELAIAVAQLDRDAVARVKRLVAEAAGNLPAIEREAAGNRAWHH